MVQAIPRSRQSVLTLSSARACACAWSRSPGLELCALKRTLEELSAINRFPPAMRLIRAGSAVAGVRENRVAEAGMPSFFPSGMVFQEKPGGAS